MGRLSWDKKDGQMPPVCSGASRYVIAGEDRGRARRWMRVQEGELRNKMKLIDLLRTRVGKVYTIQVLGSNLEGDYYTSNIICL